MFTRAAFDFSGGFQSNPIIRGVRIWKDFLCEDLDQPNPVSLNLQTPVTGPPTIRNITAANTANQPCASCHTSIINPIGFGLGNYDAYSRYQTFETLYNQDGTVNNAYANGVAVNAETQPFTPLGDSTQFNDPISYTSALGASPAFNGCFVRNYFRFSQSRLESLSGDGCQLTQMLNTLSNSSNSGSIQGMIQGVVSSSYFSNRYVTP
jgi:hypothetical protein